MTTTIYLRDYLLPGGIYPYDRLTEDMEDALAKGNEVVVISVPGFCMAFGHTELKESPWSDGEHWYETAKACILRST